MEEKRKRKRKKIKDSTSIRNLRKISDEYENNVNFFSDKLDLNEGNVDRSVKTVYRFDKEDEEEGKFWPR